MNPLLIFGAIAAVFYYRKYAAAGKLQFLPKSAKISQGKLYFVLDVVNPTQTQLVMNNLFVSFYDGKNYLGRAEITTKITIGPSQTTTLNIPIQLNGGGLVYFAANILTGKSNSLTYSGTINSEGIDVPINDTIKIL